MPQTYVDQGETITALASRIFNGNWERFTEIYDFNPDLDPFDDLKPGTQINLPEIEDILQVARPELSSIANSLGGINKAINTGDYTSIEGYAREAIKSVGIINGSVNDAVSVIKDNVTNRNYKNVPVQLVNWLLENR